jgi:uncharacterized membrane protein
MDIELTNQTKKVRIFSRLIGFFKDLPMNFKSKVINAKNSVKKIGKDDPRRIIHSLKVGFALTVVSLFYYSRPLYNGFGVAGMWAVLTVVVVFEFTVGKFNIIHIKIIMYYILLLNYYILFRS